MNNKANNNIIKDSNIIKKIAVLLVEIWKTLISSFKAFFDINDNNVKDGTKKIALTAARRAVYLALDYWAALGSAIIVGLMNYWNFGFTAIVAASWAYDFIIASTFLIISEKSGHDITLGESFRRAADVIRSKHRLVGYITFIYLTIKATIWDGPEQVVIFFKKEIKTMSRMMWILFFLTFIQGAFWAWIYSLGYNGLSELIRGIF